MSNPPPTPNAVVPLIGTAVFDLTLDTFYEDPGPVEGPVITWNSPNLLIHYNYSGGVLINCETYMAVNCTGEDGDVEISASMYKEGSGALVGRTSATFPMVAGESYWLTLIISVSGYDEYINYYGVTWGSPCAATSRPVPFLSLVNRRALSIRGPYVN